MIGDTAYFTWRERQRQATTEPTTNDMNGTTMTTTEPTTNDMNGTTMTTTEPTTNDMNGTTMTTTEPTTEVTSYFHSPMIGQTITTTHLRDVAGKDDRIVALTNAKSDLDSRLESSRTLNVTRQQSLDAYRSAFERLGEYIIEAANDNDLCGVFDSAVETWNSQESYLYQLPTRQTEGSIEMTIRISSSYGANDEDLEETSPRYLSSIIEAAVTEYLEGEDHTDISVSV